MPGARPTMALWQMMSGPMPMLWPTRLMWAQQLRRALQKWSRPHRRWPQRLLRPALRHPMGPIFFLSHGSP